VFPAEFDAPRGSITQLSQGRFSAAFGDIRPASRVKRRKESACHGFRSIGSDHVNGSR
jgi:hypothetical protein